MQPRNLAPNNPKRSPFGMLMPGRGSGAPEYRYAYNGMELDNEPKGNGNSYTTEFRQYDPRLGRWKSLDPVVHPHFSPYSSMDNNPISFNDPLGNDVIWGDDRGNGANSPSDREKKFIIRQLRTKRIFGAKDVRKVAKQILTGQNNVYISVYSSNSVEIFENTVRDDEGNIIDIGNPTGTYNYRGMNSTGPATAISNEALDGIKNMIEDECKCSVYEDETAKKLFSWFEENWINYEVARNTPGMGCDSYIDLCWDETYFNNFEQSDLIRKRLKKLQKDILWHEIKHAYNNTTGNHNPNKIEEEIDASIFANKVFMFDKDRKFYTLSNAGIIINIEDTKGIDQVPKTEESKSVPRF